MTLESERVQKRLAREASAETRETKEDEQSEELKAAAAMERAELIVKEVKQSKKQMQNILLHLQDVTQAIQALRTQLALGQSAQDPSSVQHDKDRLRLLQEKIHGYEKEILVMKDDLIVEKEAELRTKHPHQTDEAIRTEAEASIRALLHEVASMPNILG